MASGNFVISTNMAGSVTQTNGYWSSTPNYTNNTSTMTVEYYVTKASGFSSTFGTGTFGINVDGTNYSVTKSLTIPAGPSTTLVHRVTGIIINHNANGTRSVAISVSGGIPGTSWTTTTGSTTAVLEDTLPDPVFTDSTITATGNVGTYYSDAVVASSATSYSVFSGDLPAGITLNTSTGTITGTPTAPGVFTFVIRATNGSGSVNTGTLTITVLSGAKVWNGTAFVAGTTMVWDGTAFVSSTTKVWDGSEWVSAS
jgi:hypothetical protein